MGKRSRKTRHTAAPVAPRPTAPPQPSSRERMEARYARSEQRNAEIRARLEPLAPGERPGAVTTAALVALVLALANTASLLLGETITGDEVTVAGVGLSVVLFVAAAGMWQARYWAVLGFQALLAIQIVICAGALLVAPGWWQALVLFVLVALGGWLFWKLIRALARMQMPER